LRVAWASSSGDDCLRLTGWPPRALARVAAMGQSERGRWVPVYPAELIDSALGTNKLPSVAGNYEVDGDALCFVPTYPFVAGTSYTVLVHHSLIEATAMFELDDFDPFTITRVRDELIAPAARVVAIHPSAEEVPRNLLRFYLHFSAPMSEGFVAEHVHVVDALTGEPLLGVLLPMEPELWDPERTRVTVLFDPARIKQGLAPHREAGYPLCEGATVEVVVDDGFADAHGRPLADAFHRRYRVGGDVRRRVEPAEWELCAPAAGSRDPVVIGFDRPLDHALLRRCLVVVDADGDGDATRVPGRAEVPDGERSWEFTPAAGWHDAPYGLVVDTTLEDLAGNSVARVFDRDLAEPDHDPIPAKHVTLEFRPI
jgi:hypothetical protein